MSHAREPIFDDRNRYDRVESQQGEVGQIVSSQPLRGQMGMDQAQAAEPSATGTQTTPIGQLDARRGSDHDVFDISASIDEDADLAANLR